MYTEGFEQWFKMNKNLNVPMSEWNKATTDMLKHLTEQNLEIISDNFSHLSDQLKRFSNIRKPEDLLHLQKECLTEDMSLLIEDMQKIAHASLESIEELSKLLSLTTRESMAVVKTAEKRREKEKV